MRLIDADALKVNCDIMVGGITIGRRDYVMFHEIDSAPTIEPKQGEWIIDVYKYGKERYTCSECGKGSIEGYDFCPNCGVRMRGTNDEDNEA